MLTTSFLGYPDLYSWLHDWLPIIFMGLLVVAVFALMRMMPRTRPSETKPDSTPAIGSRYPCSMPSILAPYEPLSFRKHLAHVVLLPFARAQHARARTAIT